MHEKRQKKCLKQLKVVLRRYERIDRFRNSVYSILKKSFPEKLHSNPVYVEIKKRVFLLNKKEVLNTISNILLKNQNEEIEEESSEPIQQKSSKDLYRSAVRLSRLMFKKLEGNLFWKLIEIGDSLLIEHHRESIELIASALSDSPKHFTREVTISLKYRI